MAFYVPEIKEEVSEDAKILVEENGKIVRTNLPKYEPPKSESSGPDIVLKTSNLNNKDAYIIEKFSFDTDKILNGQLTAMLIYTWWDEGIGVGEVIPLSVCNFSVLGEESWAIPGNDFQIRSITLYFDDLREQRIACKFNSDINNPSIKSIEIN